MSWEFAIGIALFGAVFTTAYLAVKLDKKYGPLQIFFLVLSLYMIAVSFGVGIQFANDNAAPEIKTQLLGAYEIFLYVPIVVLFYFIVQFIWNLATKIKGDNAQKKEEAF